MDIPLSAVLGARLGGGTPWHWCCHLAGWRPSSATFGATWAVSQHLDLRGEVAVLNVNGGYSPGDYRMFGLSVLVRP